METLLGRQMDERGVVRRPVFRRMSFDAPRSPGEPERPRAVLARAARIDNHRGRSAVPVV